MFRQILASTALGILVVQLPALAAAQEPFVARANVTVENDSPVPQTVAGTNVSPFQLLPHQQAELQMSVAPPPTSGGPPPVQFQYSVGVTPGPSCHGTIDMSLQAGELPDQYTVTDCSAHSLGTGGADCKIAVSARNALCQGGLAFTAH
jgi:hypothetical protein